MRKLAIAVTAAAALLAGPALDARPRLTPQQELDKLLVGREAGRPEHCISNFDAREIRVLDRTAIVFGWAIRSGSIPRAMPSTSMTMTFW